jgi:hypothetical protein
VKDLLHRDGDSCLPLVVMNGEIVGHGAYPRRDQLAELAGLTASVSRAKPRIRLNTGDCCKPDSGCC